MIGIDTNLLLRLLVDDDAAQTRLAAERVRTETAAGRPVLINLIVLCELVWVLGRSYRFSRREIADAVEAVLNSPVFAVQEPGIVRAGVAAEREGGDFADAVVARLNQTLGADVTATFDRGAAKLEGFSLVR